ncbi:hypothetical protein SAMN05443661_12518 [Natronobacterium gregoryi]|nr:hypothetical protein Natgr_2135 [Natronobacterium gregoryi SP2]PLK19924.1 hypothetical protein CYV19_12335 [Natronobacterium gregoryi SP2]SFJ37549.1 hypothetical protein SAMN05443661_12518 [Natronobacterium gregoryi]
MTQLTIPADVDGQAAAKLVRDHVEVGETVEVRKTERTGSDDVELAGEVTGIESGYLEIDGHPPTEGSPRYDEIHTIVKVETKK